MPPNTVKVARPTKWGNPFVVERDGELWCVRDSLGIWSITKETRAEANRAAVRLFRAYLANDGSQPGQIRDAGGAFLAQIAPEELGGKNLACYCPLDRPCHADVLLEIANEGTDQ